MAAEPEDPAWRSRAAEIGESHGVMGSRGAHAREAGRHARERRHTWHLRRRSVNCERQDPARTLTLTATTPRLNARCTILRTQNTTHSMARHIYERLAGHNEDKTAPAPTWREALQLTERPRPGPRPFSQPQRGGCPDQLSPSAASGHSGQRRPAMRARAPVRAPPKAACEPEREAAPLCRGYGGNAQCALRRRRKQA
jgi:hypothetical protein